MGILGKLKLTQKTADVDIEEYLNTLASDSGDLLEEHADMWVKPHVLEDVVDIEKVSEDLRQGNMVLLNIEPLYKKNTIKLRQAVSELKGTTHEINGDMARLSET